MSNNGRDRPPGSGGGSPDWVRARGHNVQPGARRGGGGGYSSGGGGGGGGGGAAFATATRFGSAGATMAAPWDVKPPSGRDFQFSGVLPTATAATTPAVIPGAFSIPTDNVGVVRSVVFLVNDLLQSSRVFFSLEANNAALEGWGSLLVLPRLAGSVGVSYGPQETYPFVDENQTVRVTVNVTDAGSYQVSSTVHGWFYPKELHEQYLASIGGL